MVKTSKIIATLGVAAGLGIALLPVASHATDPIDTTDGTTVTVNVADTIAVAVEASDVHYTTGSAIVVDSTNEFKNEDGLYHDVHVSGTTYNDYTLTMYESANDGALKHVSANATIPTFTTAVDNLAEGTWGMKYSGKNDTTYSSKWNGVGTQSSPATIYSASSTKHSEYYNDTFKVKYGVYAAEDQLAGQYTATIVYSATAAASI